MYDDRVDEDRISLWSQFKAAWARMNDWRPVSFYLIFAIFIVLLSGTQLYFIRDNPQRYAFVLSLMFVFFFFTMVLAVLDITELVRRNLRERRDVYRATLGDDAFVRELGRRVADNRENE